MRDIYIVGAKGVGQYGGYETFVQNLIGYSKNVRYHVACKANGDGCMDLNKTDNLSDLTEDSFRFNDTECYLIKVPNIGPAQAIYYDIASLRRCIKEIKENKVKDPIVYVLACRIGPFFKNYVDQIHGFSGSVYINPDGHEWKRAKWSKLIRAYWKISEKLMVKHADLVVCDSVNIEKYIRNEYQDYKPKTTFIAYGSDTSPSLLKDDESSFVNWLKDHGLRKKEYYLSVGRFVPENNFETMIREFMQSDSKKDFALITNVNEKFLNQLEERLHFKNDKRIKFVGTVYDKELLKKIRENAFAYFHGHEVGGTNPSLLEALGSTELNLLYDVGFNREVAEDAALYWNKDPGDLSKLISTVENMNMPDVHRYGERAKNRIRDYYSWEYITRKYEELWLKK